jgi:hypothetical protein
MNTLDYQVSIIEAKRAGKVIQWQELTTGTWMEWIGDKFDFRCFDYRVKPEKIVRYLPVIKSSSGEIIICAPQYTEDDARNYYRVIDVVKVEYDPE